MSEKNGDRSRFGRLRKNKIRLRERTRQFRKTLEAKTPVIGIASPK